MQCHKRCTKIRLTRSIKTAAWHRHTMTRTMNYRTKRSRIACPPQEQDDCMVQDARSIDTGMGVRATNGSCNIPLHHHEAAKASFEIPRGQPDGRRIDKDDDNISVLTEFSGMEEEEEDASSQVTKTSESWTVVTTATDSTTIPTRNKAPELTQRRTKRRHAVVSENPFAHDNASFKRCRKR